MGIVFLRRYSFFPPGAALRIRTRDLDLWAAVALGYGLQAACCSAISAPSEKKKKKKREHGDPRRTDQSLTGSYHSAGTYSQLQGIMGNWDILLFLLQSSLYLCASLALLSSLSLSHLPSFLPFHLLLPVLPRLLSLPILIISRFHFSPSPSPPFICPSTSSSSPSSLASYLNCSARGRSRAGLPAGRIVVGGFIVRRVYRKRTERWGGERNGRDLCFPFSAASQQVSVIPTAHNKGNFA